MATIAVLISNQANRRLLYDRLGRSHHLISRTDVLEQHDPDLIICDLKNFRQHRKYLKTLRASNEHVLLPVILLIRGQLPSDILRENEEVEDVLRTPTTPLELEARVGNLLRLRFFSCQENARSDGLSQQAQQLWEAVERKTAQLREAFGETVHILTRAAEYRDDDTGLHVRRVSHYSRMLAAELGMDWTFQDRLFHASAMHDVGKIAVPDSILLKPGRLTDEEWNAMQMHTKWGEQILAVGESPYIQMGAQVARSHHERWDGTGYPDGLRGEQIPLPARIMAIADVYDALRSRRPYKKPFDQQTTLEIMLKGDNRTSPEHFDPQVLQAFRARANDLADIFATFDSEDELNQA